MVGKILGIDWSRTTVPDYEVIAKLEKIVQTNREFAQVSRKLSDSIRLTPGNTPREMKNIESIPAGAGGCIGTGRVDESLEEYDHQQQRSSSRRNLYD